jgi:hypothetical protein
LLAVMLVRGRPARPWPFWLQNHPRTFIDPARKQSTPAWHTGEGPKEKSKLTTNQREEQTDNDKRPSGTIPLKGCRVGRETDLYLDSPTGAGDMSRETKTNSTAPPNLPGDGGWVKTDAWFPLPPPPGLLIYLPFRQRSIQKATRRKLSNESYTTKAKDPEWPPGGL